MSIYINGQNRESTINRPSVTPHGTYHMSDYPNLFEPQRSNNFEFVVTDLENLYRPGTDSRIEGAQEMLRLSVASTFVPHFQQDPIEIKRGNNSLRYAGVPRFNSGNTLKVNDFIGAQSKAILEAWQALSYNVYTEKVGLASDYKKDCYLIEYTPDYQVVRQWRLHGCWVSNITEDEYNADGNDKRSISATIEYDRAEIDNSSLLDD